jgi:hypothetical protein
LHEALITAEGYPGAPIRAHLSMTSVRDCTFPEFLRAKEDAVEADPTCHIPAGSMAVF